MFFQQGLVRVCAMLPGFFDHLYSSRGSIVAPLTEDQVRVMSHRNGFVNHEKHACVITPIVRVADVIGLAYPL